MNRIFRLVWNRALNAFVAAAENARNGIGGRTSRTLSSLAASTFLLLPLAASATCLSGVIDNSLTSTCSVTAGSSIAITTAGSITTNDSPAVLGTGITGVSNAGTLSVSGSYAGENAAAIWLEGANTGDVLNTGSIGGTGIGIKVNAGGTLAGSIINRGLIDSAFVGVFTSGAIGGFLNDTTGVIRAQDGNNNGIVDLRGAVNGNVTNLGTISGDYRMGLYVGSNVVGSVINGGTITSENRDAVYVVGNVAGDFINQAGAAIRSAGYSAVVQESGIDGSILNHGSLEGSRYGLWLYWDLAKVGGQIKNTGVITGGRDGIYMYNGAVVEEGLVNTGRIEGADYSGVFVYHGSQVNGGITNSGLVQGGEHGVFVSDAVVTGGIVNTGVFNGIAGSGLSVYDASSVAGGVTNSGTIRGASSGISVTSNSAISGGITNTGSILTDGAAGIDVGSTGAIDRIDNWGTIAGPTYALQSAGNVGQVNIFGQSAILSGDVLASTADMTLRSGAVFSNSGAYDLRSFTVETGSRLNFGQGLRAAGSSLTQDGVRVTHGFSNAGWVSVASGVRPTITGDYTQSASGMFSLGLTDATTYGRLAVTGNATLANGTGLDVVVGTSAVVADGSLIPGVITAGDTLTVTPGSLKVTDNSIFYDFTPSTARNAKELDLVATADPSGIVKVGGTGILAGPAATLQTLFNSGTTTAMQPVFQKLALLNPTQFEGALTQMLPSLQGAGAQAGMSALHNMGRIVQARVEGSKGLSSGDAIQRDDYLWVRPFATRGDQSDRGGASGFESLSRGIVIGVDGVTGDRWRTGLALAYAKSDITAQSAIAPSRMDVDSYQAIGYGTYTLDEITELNYQVDIGRHTASSQRSLGFMGTSAAGRFDALAVHASLGIGRLYKVSEHANLTPSARLDVTRMRTDGYTESGAGPLDLTLGAQTYREMILSADAKLVHQIEPGLRLAANVAAGYDFQNSPVNSTAAFVGGGPVFTTQGMETSPWIYRAGLGLIKENSAGVEYSLRYDFEGRPSGYRNQTLSARARWLF